MAVIDTDPVFTQIKLGQDAALLEYYRSFDAVATFGRLIGTPGCPLPTPSGIMVGSYQMTDEDGEFFDVAIPAFSLDSPYAVRSVN
jgi:hypothetical protein